MGPAFRQAAAPLFPDAPRSFLSGPLRQAFLPPLVHRCGYTDDADSKQRQRRRFRRDRYRRCDGCSIERAAVQVDWVEPEGGSCVNLAIRVLIPIAAAAYCA